MLKTCAKLCLDSYDPKATGFVAVDDLRYGVFESPAGRIVCIRGSENAQNWLRNVRAAPWRSCNGSIAHKGFIRAFEALCKAGMPTAKDETLIATGHSLGGAIATLLAEHTGCRLVTFGSPKVYFRFTPAPELRHLRVVREDDPIPWLPGIFYSHRCTPHTLRDHDWHVAQIGDHLMKGYVKELS